MLHQILLTKLLLLYVLHTVVCNDYSIHLTSDTPTISGGVVNFEATLFYYGKPAEGSFSFYWFDDGYPRHTREVDTTKPFDKWAINYTTEYPPGPYLMTVKVSKKILFFSRDKASAHLIFDLTATLNGGLNLTQNNELLPSEYVSNDSPVLHKVKLKDSDLQFLNNTATSVITYWFIDCQYYGMTNNYEFAMNYTDFNKEHTVDALVIADFDPIPPVPISTTVAPITTTKAPVTTTKAPVTTTKPLTTTSKVTTTTSTRGPTSLNSSNVIVKGIQKRNTLETITNFSNSTLGIAATLHKEFLSPNGSMHYNGTFPYVCNNSTIIPVAANMTYGVFSKKIAVRQPIYNISVTGNNWIQHSDMLQLSVTCKGSSMFHYCIDFKEGIYNKTGNESCVFYDISEKCEFPIHRLFIFDDSDIHTVLIIIFNDVAKIVYPVTVNIYKVNKQAQLSVIVVPVASSLVAVVLIVFGVAYYIQSRSRFTVEVADFNFGQQYGDMEYKTFRERLRDSASIAFTRAPIPGGSSDVPVWPPGRKYGSMT